VALAQFGVGCAVATLGTATTPIHVSKLLRLADEIVFCFDGDSAGRKAAWRALEVSLPLAADAKPMKFLFLPERDDPDSFVRAHGQEAFERLAREAQTLSGFLLGELRAAADLGTPEGRSSFVVSAKPHLQRIAAPGLKLQLVKEVASLARLTQDEAERLLELRSAPASSYARPAPPRAEPPLPVSLEWKLLTRVFAKPGIALEIDGELLKAELPESQALLELIERLQAEEEPGALSAGALVELIAQARHAQLLARAQAALSFELKLSAEDAVAEFRDFLQALRKREPESDRLLRQKVLAGTASAEERVAFERKVVREHAPKPLN
jgi:DNA primase